MSTSRIEPDKQTDTGASSSPIPFNRSLPIGDELKHIETALENMHISGDGPFTRRSQEVIEQEVGTLKALLTTSCTHALEICALLLNLAPGDEVIIPSFTFVSTANAFALSGARPVCVDIRPDTLNINENAIEQAITPKTRAIVVVHYAGVGCEMDPILALAAKYGIPVIEDNAHGLFGRYRGRPLGSFGELATLSFHETKNISCGEGGAILVNNPSYLERTEILREKGTDRSRFMRGEVQKYTWVDVGSSYLPSDLLAGYLFGQLEQREWIQNTRRRIWERYATDLHDWASRHGVRLPSIPEHCDQAYHLFYLLFPQAGARDRFIDHMGSRNISSVFHYQPLHLSRMGERFGGKPGDCPVAEEVSQTLVRLPFFTTILPADQERTINAVLEFNP
jgi:dTDP-4-amino-4,6-dideoxygalactose transaminase